jgi:hypothetical protein
MLINYLRKKIYSHLDIKHILIQNTMTDSNILLFTFSGQGDKSPHDYYLTFRNELEQAKIPMDSKIAKLCFYIGLSDEYKAKVPQTEGHQFCDPTKLVFYFALKENIESRCKA